MSLHRQYVQACDWINDFCSKSERNMSYSRPESAFLEAVFNHVALPRKLPGVLDSQLPQIEDNLIERLLNTAKELTVCQLGLHWDHLRRSLQTCRALNVNRRLESRSLVREFGELANKDILILQVAEQNAGLLVYRQESNVGDHVVFETFEASPISSDVLASENALRWDFPGSAAAVPWAQFADAPFQKNLSRFLERASTESIKQSAAQTRKAGSGAFESRNTATPDIITQMLVAILEANGNRTFPPLLRKRVRDDASWKDGAERPWRRSPMWLVLRVGIQRRLSTLLGGATGRVHYKVLLALLMTRTLEDTIDSLSPELIHFLKAKVCRRIAKLEAEMSSSEGHVNQIYKTFFENLNARFHSTLQKANAHIYALWTEFKSNSLRRITPLPQRAKDTELRLTLTNSFGYLNQVLLRPPHDRSKVKPNHWQAILAFETSTAATKQFKSFSMRYFHLSDLEEELNVEFHRRSTVPKTSDERECTRIADKINVYLDTIGESYMANPEQSSVMILTAMDLWTSMDQHALKAFPLLEDYHPGFPEGLFDILHVPLRKDMDRLKKIEAHLHYRRTCSNKLHLSIFADPVVGCFAERYFLESEAAPELQLLKAQIEAEAETARSRKEVELQNLSRDYEELIKKVDGSACAYTTDERQPLVRVHDDRACTKCYLQRKASRMRIRVHERPLPADETRLRAVIFELRCPEAFVVYRDVTRRILATCARQGHIEGHRPKMLLQDYSELTAYRRPVHRRVSLASNVKSFLQTHHSEVPFPVDIEQVCLPNGLKWGYYDSATESWPSREKERPTFAHHCQIKVETSSPFSFVNLSPQFTIGSSGPSSAEICASQTRCPSGLTVHEFLAYQSLYTGRSCRWPLILVELGSSSLNFSSDSPSTLVSRLISQAGPGLDGDPLRKIHCIFRDEYFCSSLADRISERLESIKLNYRETNCMEMIINLTLRLHSLATSSLLQQKAAAILEKARAIILKWLALLRVDLRKATDNTVSHRCSRNALWAAILGRRCLWVYAKKPGLLDPDALRCFIRSSVAMQDHMDSDPTNLPLRLRNALVTDLKMVRPMRFLLRDSLDASPDSLYFAVDFLWESFKDTSPRPFSQFTYTEDWWIRTILTPDLSTMPQLVHFHLLEGHLLLNGHSLGKLPAEHRESHVLRELFGEQNLLIYPSADPFMTWVLPVTYQGHQIQIGFRDDKLIIRAYIANNILELIPRNIFGNRLNNLDFDLPHPLVSDCLHWMNVRTGEIEIRRKPNIWTTIPSNWILNLKSRRVHRRNSCLVDPHSMLFKRVARIFDQWEHSHFLTVYQPGRHRLSVELRRMELFFMVNYKGLLESKQLQAEIDYNQDCGCFYGLYSKLVLRSLSNSRQRSVVMPFGDLTYKRNGPHVIVHIVNNGRTYCRYIVNDILGRIESPPEPCLIYFKALLHASTSFVVADTLTSRTGTEEAIEILNMGNSQPWTPLTTVPCNILNHIAKLSPKLEYYLKGLREMKTTQWNPDLTITIQHEEFRRIVETIREKSEQLATFGLEETSLPGLEYGGDRKLLMRNIQRFRRYQRPYAGLEKHDPVTKDYEARDRYGASVRNDNVLEVVSTLRDWPETIGTTRDLAGILQKWPTIGGYAQELDVVVLSDLLSLDIAVSWGSIAQHCRGSSFDDRHALMFLFAVIVFRYDANMEAIRVLIAYAVFHDLSLLDTPMWPSYLDFKLYRVLSEEDLVRVMKPARTPYPGDERSLFPVSGKMRRKLELTERTHMKQVEEDCRDLSQYLLRQWPCVRPTIQGFSHEVKLDIEQAIEAIIPEWQSCFQNMELSKHIEQVQHILDLHFLDGQLGRPRIVVESQELYASITKPLTCNHNLAELMQRCGPDLTRGSALAGCLDQSTLEGASSISKQSQGSYRSQNTKIPIPQSATELKSIVERFISSDSNVRKQYGLDLRRSLDALMTTQNRVTEKSVSFDLVGVGRMSTKALGQVQHNFLRIVTAIQEADHFAPWLTLGDLWPCVTPTSLLPQLRSSSQIAFGTNMKEALIEYALSVTTYQRGRRIEDALLRDDTRRVLEEQENPGHENWRPSDYPDWLLLEIEADLMIRKTQVEVALATITPVSQANAVLQMNMGQGKTSCIIPMVSVILADGQSLARVVVPKSLLLQTAQLLHDRLGGLLGRETRHIPFSRKTPTDTEHIKNYYDIHRSVWKARGVVLTVPEQILSFKLGGLQRTLDNRLAEAKPMVKVQAWINEVARDILDECDIALAVRTQLIYPSGTRSVVDGHPHRWETAELILHLVGAHIWDLQNTFPCSLEIIDRPGGFPMIFFLRKDAEDTLIARVTEDICKGHTGILPLRECSDALRTAIKQFVSQAQVSEKNVEMVRKSFPGKIAVRQKIYLLRGLLVHRILLLAIKKRWNVQYGLHPKRDPIAVPYHAKGVPSENAEWGHPDVAILFSCLSFYYGGLSMKQLRQSLEFVLKSDDPSIEYDRWAQRCGSVPNSLKEWRAVNVEDEVQLKELWSHFRYSATVINHFLNSFVFPRHAKQFQVKLCASGWDIPCFTSLNAPDSTDHVHKRAQPTKCLTTGFSGTNDNRSMLPLIVKQQDLPTLLHTNAEVLTYLLQDRNRRYELAAKRNTGLRLSEDELLSKLKHKGIRVLIDAGAQILEMDNITLARRWLTIDTKAAAAIYFDDGNKPYVLYRQGVKVPLLATPFAENPLDCVVYLDEAHTRGTDLKLPADARGALTLGLGQTKDHTVQAAMRLRQLATTQSITFIAPPEVHQSILDFRKKPLMGRVDSHDVISWLLEQTCMGIEQLQPLYYSQGADFCRRMQTLVSNPEFITMQSQRDECLRTLKQLERQTLEQLYSPRVRNRVSRLSEFSNQQLIAYMKDLATRKRQFRDTGDAVHGSALQEVEQERETAYEVEAVREAQKPVHFSALSFGGLHRDVAVFSRTGRLVVGSTGFEPMMKALAFTALGRKYDLSAGAACKLYISTEFSRTVSTPTGQPNDNFIRPVQWIVWSSSYQAALVVTPEEAELIMPIVARADVHLAHLLTYAAPVTRKMLTFNRLDYYAVPSLPKDWNAPKWLMLELGLFAGRLFFEYDEYQELQEYLGLETPGDQTSGTIEHGQTEKDQEGSHSINGSDGKLGGAVAQKTSFPKNPLNFLHDWLAIRRKGQDFLHTPMGYLCQGKPLAENHPFFQKHDRCEETVFEHDPKATREWCGEDQTEEAEEELCYEEFYDAQEEAEEDVVEFPEAEDDLI